MMKEGGIFRLACQWERRRVMAGLALTCSLSEFRDGNVQETGTSMTTFANADRERAHNRMSAILPIVAFGAGLPSTRLSLMLMASTMIPHG